MKDDSVLISRTLDGDMQAFRWLITKHEGLVAHVVRRIVRDSMDTEEVCQDVFMKVFAKLATFKGDAKFTTWLVTIAYRTSLNYINKKRIQTDSLDEVRVALADAELPSHAMEKQELRDMLEALIERLPDNYRIVITLFHLQDMSYEDVSNITGMPLGTVKNYLYRGRNLLKEQLEKRNFSEIK